MDFRQKLSRMWRSRRAPRQSLLASAASLRGIEALAAQRRLDELRASAAARNPLLACGAKVFSQNDEDGLIEEILRRIGLGGRAGSFVELGVGDGSENNTLNLFAQGWRGVWLGGVPVPYACDPRRLRFKQCWIDRDNVVTLMRAELNALGVAGQPDLVSLDLDGNDWHLARAMLEGGFAPQVFVLEYNASFRPGTRWVMPYDARHEWDGSAYFGASLASFDDLFARHGYRLVACNVTGANAFFVRRERAAAFSDVPEAVASLYMPPNYLPYFGGGHPHNPRFIASVLSGAGAGEG